MPRPPSRFTKPLPPPARTWRRPDCPECGVAVGVVRPGGPMYDDPGLQVPHVCQTKEPPPVTDFDQPTDGLVRDQYKRPLIIPAGGGDRIPYTRASSLADYISDTSWLTPWKLGLLARGLAAREDLAAMIAGLPPLTGDAATDRPVKRQLAEYVDAALETAGASAKANYGTAIHSFTDPAPSGGPVPERMVGDVESFRRAMAGLEILATECFVVNDTYRAAGTFDHLVRWPGLGILVADKKTGTLHPHDHAVQLAVYAGGDFYEGRGDIRTPMPEDVHPNVGLVIHIPAGEQKTEFHFVDLVKGRAAAARASWVRDYQSDKTVSEPAPDHLLPLRADIAAAIATAESKAALTALRTANAEIWHDDLTALGVARLAVLASQTPAVV